MSKANQCVVATDFIDWRVTYRLYISENKLSILKNIVYKHSMEYKLYSVKIVLWNMKRKMIIIKRRHIS